MGVILVAVLGLVAGGATLVLLALVGAGAWEGIGRDE